MHILAFDRLTTLNTFSNLIPNTKFSIKCIYRGTQNVDEGLRFWEYFIHNASQI